MMRPFPTNSLLIAIGDVFEPSEHLRDWIFATFINEGGRLENPDHAHLVDARIGVLWTNCDNARAMRTVVGQAEIMPPMAMGKWQRARAVQQITEWFDEMPDFLLTFHAAASDAMDDASFCALVEHELYHCAQNRDAYGMPKFKDDGSPSFGIRGHDVEQFVGVVARYGADAADVREMVAAANRGPSVGLATIAGACGTCLRAVA